MKPNIIQALALTTLAMGAGCKSRSLSDVKSYYSEPVKSDQPGFSNAVGLTTFPFGMSHQSCSAAVIAPGLLATAAHCVLDATDLTIHTGEHYAVREPKPNELVAERLPPPVMGEPPSPGPLMLSGCRSPIGLVEPKVYGGVIDDEAASTIKPTTYNYHDQFGTSGSTFDIAWIKFDPGSSPIELQAISSLPDVAQLQRASRLVVVGYGRNETGLSGERRAVPIESVKVINTEENRDLLLVTGKDGKPVGCHGDSGGPLYAEVDGQWFVAGVAHGVNADIAPVVMKDKDIDCAKQTTTLYTFIGAYDDWLTQSQKEPKTPGTVANRSVMVDTDCGEIGGQSPQ